MMMSPVSDAFGHHVWATMRVIDACADLSDEQLAASPVGTYGTILETLRHLVGGDVFYLDVLGERRAEPFDEDGADLAALRAVMVEDGAAWERVIGGDIDAAADVVEIEPNGAVTHATLGIRLAQAIHHGTDHRSQICTALSVQGIAAPAIDVWDYGESVGSVKNVEPPGA